MTGNHDTYIDQERERDLMSRIEDKLGVPVYDVLRVKRNGEIAYVVTHGHQFDESCMQHGSIPFAKSLGELYSECVAWCNWNAQIAWRYGSASEIYTTTHRRLAALIASPVPTPIAVVPAKAGSS